MAEGRTGEGSLWGGRFEVPPAQAMVELSRSTHFDWALAPYDIAQGTAHAAALLRAGLLDESTYAALVALESRGAVRVLVDFTDQRKCSGVKRWELMPAGVRMMFAQPQELESA